jgi:hypothetical protein
MACFSQRLELGRQDAPYDVILYAVIVVTDEVADATNGMPVDSGLQILYLTSKFCRDF